MPRSKNIYAYPTALFKLARAMHDQAFQELRIPYDNINEAKSRRQEWYAFMRAHQTSIELAQKRIRGALLNKNERELEIWRNKLDAMDLQLEAIQRYEVIVDIDLNISATKCTLIFRNKAARMTQLDAALASIGAKEQTLEEMLEFATAALPTNAPILLGKQPSLRDDPVLGHLFGMPIEEKIALGAASAQDLSESQRPFLELRDLILNVENNEHRERMLSNLHSLSDPVHSQDVPIDLSEFSTDNTPLRNDTSKALPQLDSAGPIGHPAPEPTGSNFSPSTSEENANGNS